MELLYIFSYLKRTFIRTLSAAVIVMFTSILFTSFFMSDTYKTTIIFQTSSKALATDTQSVDPLANFEAADRFSEAMLGWFRNPIVFDDIAQRVEGIEGSDISKIFAIRRQEKQNINITFTVASEEQAEKLQKAITDYIQFRVSQVNSSSNASYELVGLDYKIEEISPSMAKNAMYALILGYVMFAILGFAYEIALGRLIYIEQAEDILGVKHVDTLHHKKSLHFFLSYLQKIDGPVLVLSLGKHADHLMKHLVTTAKQTHTSLVLLEADRDAALSKHLSVSSLSKKYKGVFSKTGTLSQLARPLDQENPEITFVGASEGNTINHKLISELEKANGLRIVYSNLHTTQDAFSLMHLPVVILAEPGITTRAELKEVRHLADQTHLFSI